MTVKERERIEVAPAEEAPIARRGTGWIFVLVAAIAIAAVVAVAVYFAVSDDGTAEVAAEPAAVSLLTEDQIALVQLANRGYIPQAAGDADRFVLEALVNRGLVPALALEPATEATGTEPLTLEQLANRGLIPAAAVPEPSVLEQLVNRGLVPAQALEPAAQPVEPLFTEEEMATMTLANQGLIPHDSVDWEDVELRRLVNRGLIPRAAVE